MSAVLAALVVLAAADYSSIPSRMQEYADAGKVAGSVALVMRDGKVVHLSAVGHQDLESKRPMRTDSIFQIMSMTKPVTAVALMMLVDEGRLSLYDRVSYHLPEFEGQKLKSGAKPARPVRIYDLLTHTSGMPNMPRGEMRQLISTLDHTLAEAVRSYGSEALEFEPGSRILYSNPGIATVGRIIEVVSGEPYEQFIERRILQPLGMKDTFFFPPADKLDRIAMVYEHRDGKLARLGPDALGGDPKLYRHGSKYPGPEFGLFTTAEDLARFYGMMLGRGEWNGVRLLSPAAVETLTTPLTEGLPKDVSRPVGRDFALAWEVVTKATGTLSFVPLGSFGHGGAFGTQGWVMPKTGTVVVFLVATDDEDEYSPRDAVLQIIGAQGQR